ncbi:MAG: helix-turn-helix transcriptional regulator [Nitrosotalea sp.]
MAEDYNKIAGDFLEISSEQRLAILNKLYRSNSKISIIAKELNATVPEIFRNFERLLKADLITKDSDGSYKISPYGKILCLQIPTLRFLSDNSKYLRDHDFGNMPERFLHRIGSLEKSQHVKGFVKVLEVWQEIYENANEYICNVLLEVPYTSEMMEVLAKKINNGIKLQSILSQDSIISKDRKQIFSKLGFKKMIDDGKIERKMTKVVNVVIVLNEKEACVMFPTNDGEVDMSHAFFGRDDDFHDWALDYFEYCWKKAGPFVESRLKE